MMESTKEKTPFVIEFKSNYGTTTPSASASPSTLYCLHGQPQVKIVGHCHRQRSEGVDLKARKKLIIASVLCLLFMVAEIVGGVLSNSLAIATDAAHLLTDFASFMISLFAIWLAGRPSTKRMSFGWYRAEVIGAVASVAMIWVITAILIWLAIQRIINKTYEVDANIMLITSALAIIVNVIMGFQLHHHHGHSHATSELPSPSSSPPTVLTTTNSRRTSRISSHIALANTNTTTDQIAHISDASIPSTPPTGGAPRTAKDTKAEPSQLANVLYQSSDNGGMVNTISSTQHYGQQDNEAGVGWAHGKDAVHGSGAHDENINVRAAFIHVLGDVLQSIGVFIAALVIYFKPEWAIADPICTFVFSVIVLFTTFTIMKDALMVLMEGTPSYLHYAEVMNVFLQIEGVERVHNLRIWALSINKIALSAHLAIKCTVNPKEILQAATTAVHLKYNFFETTIQIEDFTPEMEDCQQCLGPK